MMGFAARRVGAVVDGRAVVALLAARCALRLPTHLPHPRTHLPTSATPPSPILRRAGGHGAGVNGGGGDEEAEVETLLGRVSESRHASERREALAQLRDVLQEGSAAAQAAVGAMGLPVLLAVLTEDRDDAELVRTAVEALALSFAATPGGGGGGIAAAPGSPTALQQRGEVRGAGACEGNAGLLFL